MQSELIDTFYSEPFRRSEAISNKTAGCLDSVKDIRHSHKQEQKQVGKINDHRQRMKHDHLFVTVGCEVGHGCDEAQKSNQEPTGHFACNRAAPFDVVVAFFSFFLIAVVTFAAALFKHK